jgi:hypothetical protein
MLPPAPGPVSVAGLPQFEVEAVEQAMAEGGHHDAYDDEEDDPGEQRVEGGEELSGRAPDRVDRPHAPENHGRVEERVEPGEPLQVVIARDTDAERHGNDGQADQDMVEKAPDELFERQKRLGLMLVHRDAFYHKSRTECQTALFMTAPKLR